LLREKVTAYENEEEETEAQTNAMATNLKSVQNRLEEEKKNSGQLQTAIEGSKSFAPTHKKNIEKHNTGKRTRDC
jgi:hypothetical protein